MNGLLKVGCIFLGATTAAIGLSACVSDGYGGGYSSFSVGVSSYDDGYGYGYPRGYGYGYRGYGDRDGDGVPNWADRRPRNPWRD
jgi:hypothetical protein